MSFPPELYLRDLRQRKADPTDLEATSSLPTRSYTVSRLLGDVTSRGLKMFDWFLEQGNLICWIMLVMKRFFASRKVETMLSQQNGLSTGTSPRKVVIHKHSRAVILQEGVMFLCFVFGRKKIIYEYAAKSRIR
jgi:hypothetical protein